LGYPRVTLLYPGLPSCAFALSNQQDPAPLHGSPAKSRLICGQLNVKENTRNGAHRFAQIRTTGTTRQRGPMRVMRVSLTAPRTRTCSPKAGALRPSA